MPDFAPDPKPQKPSDAARKKRAKLRKYGADECIVFITELPCATCGRPAGDGSAGNPKNQNSHIITGGTGFKAGYLDIISQCFACHAAMPKIKTFLRKMGLTMGDLHKMAVMTEWRWQSHLQRTENNHG